MRQLFASFFSFSSLIYRAMLKFYCSINVGAENLLPAKSAAVILIFFLSFSSLIYRAMLKFYCSINVGAENLLPAKSAAVILIFFLSFSSLIYRAMLKFYCRINVGAENLLLSLIFFAVFFCPDFLVYSVPILRQKRKVPR